MAAKTETIFCVNHPQTETYLRCNKCGQPVCIKCVQRTPVGYRCKECLGIQREGYYTATPLDYVLGALVGTGVATLAGIIMGFFTGMWLLAIFGGPLGGGIVAEAIRRVAGKRRGRYLWLVACAAVVVGGVIGVYGAPLLTTLVSGRLALLRTLSFGWLVNLGFWIYLALAVSTAYARLRT